MAFVTLAQILQARDDRAALQQTLLQKYGCPLICFTMNIAGPVKVTPLIRRAFFQGVSQLKEALGSLDVLHCQVKTPDTGCQAIYAVDAPAAQLKELCTKIEEATPLGRLFDMDVIDSDGTKLSRDRLRGCIVCGAPGRECAAGRLHSVEQLQQTTNHIIIDYFVHCGSRYIAGLAVQSLIKEVHTTPKPGLVDERNNGSHKDMDIALFEASAKALRPYFADCFAIGTLTKDMLPSEAFLNLRARGIRAEQEMFAATGGVNTHKGAIYTLGIICAAAGRLWSPENPAFSTCKITAVCAELARDAAASDFVACNADTAGIKLYRQYGITGIRGEMAAGLPSIVNIALPAYQNALAQGMSQNDAGVYTLLHLIANVQDTNLYHRGGVKGAQFAQNAAKALLQNGSYTMQQVFDMDTAFMMRGLSPGGCADLLAATYLLHKLNS